MLITPPPRQTTQGGQPVQNTSWQLPFNAPERRQTLDNWGNLSPQYQLDVTRERPESPWLRQAIGRDEAVHQMHRDQAMRDNMAGQTSAWNNLARTGGLDSGARERIARTGQRDLASSNALLANQAAQNQMGLRMQDFQNQVAADQYNIGNTLGQVDREFAADMGIFQERAKAYGADQTANAIAGAGQQKGFMDRLTSTGDNSFWGDMKGVTGGNPWVTGAATILAAPAVLGGAALNRMTGGKLNWKL